jgi:hypothetical protein
MSGWLKDCEVCNAGLCATVDRLKGDGKSEREAARSMSEESAGLYSAEAILHRYRYHTGKVKRGACEIHMDKPNDLGDLLARKREAFSLAQQYAEEALRLEREIGQHLIEAEDLDAPHKENERLLQASDAWLTDAEGRRARRQQERGTPAYFQALANSNRRADAISDAWDNHFLKAAKYFPEFECWRPRPKGEVEERPPT